MPSEQDTSQDDWHQTQEAHPIFVDLRRVVHSYTVKYQVSSIRKKSEDSSPDHNIVLTDSVLDRLLDFSQAPSILSTCCLLWAVLVDYEEDWEHQATDTTNYDDCLTCQESKHESDDWAENWYGDGEDTDCQ